MEPTNNRAERSLRPMVIKRRISQQNRGADNMDSYAMQMSLYISLKLQGTDYVENLRNILQSQVPRNCTYLEVLLISPKLYIFEKYCYPLGLYA